MNGYCCCLSLRRRRFAPARSTTHTIAVKLNPMTEHVKSPGLPDGDFQPIQLLVHHILDPTALHTDKVVMHGDVPVKPRHLVPDVDFLDQSGFSQHPRV